MTRAIFEKRKLARIGLLVLGAAWSLAFGAADDAAARNAPPGDLFYNYYVPPVGPESVGAAMYPCPRPTPPLVGHTYFTYQPLMPHEFLYQHRRTYYTSHPDAPTTQTSVKWRRQLGPRLPAWLSLTPMH